MPLKADLLNELPDEELQSVISRCNELLQQRDRERKNKALEDARATLAAVGLSLKDLNGKARKLAKSPSYHAGHHYQHPTNKALTWNAKGKKPYWLGELEAQGIKPVGLPPEAANDIIPSPVKKTG
jgi:DNA-binding protein H-NS